MNIVVCVKQAPDTAAIVTVQDGKVSWGDAPLVRREAHTLQGAAGNVSAVALRELALEAEKAGAAAELDRVASLIAKIDKHFEILKKTVAQPGSRVPAT